MDRTDQQDYYSRCIHNVNIEEIFKEVNSEQNFSENEDDTRLDSGACDIDRSVIVHKRLTSIPVQTTKKKKKI